MSDSTGNTQNYTGNNLSQPTPTTGTSTHAQHSRTADITHILSCARRCHVISLLDRHEEIALSKLTDIISVHEASVNDERQTSQQRKTVYVGLYQTHLPKLDEYEVVDVDDRKNIVSRGPEYELYQRALDQMHDLVETEVEA